MPEETFETLAGEADAQIRAGEKIAEENISTANTDEARAVFEGVLKHLKDVEKAHGAFDDHALNAFQLLNAGKLAEVERIRGDIEREGIALGHDLERFLGSVEKFTERAVLTAEHHEQTAMQLLLAVSLIALITSLGLAVIITRGVLSSVSGALAAAERITEGDLMTPIEISSSKDEAGRLLQAMKTMTNRLHDVVNMVLASTGTVATASSEIAQGSMELSQRTEEQASSLEETSSSLEEMTSTVKQNADNASQANQLAKGARDVAERGSNVVALAVDSMTEINEASKKIAEIIGAIDGIAF